MSALLKLDLKAPHQVYRNKAGKKLPGVTTVLGDVYAKFPIIRWTGTEERAGILRFMGSDTWTAKDLDKALPLNDKGDPRLFSEVKRDRAADVGTVGHAHIQAFLAGTILDTDGVDPKLYAEGLVPLGRFEGWWMESELTLVQSEHQMASEAWQVGGTADVVARAPDGLLELWDVKTGKPWFSGYPYDEQFAQTAAYADMYQEVTGEAIARIRIARVGKTSGDPGQLYTVSSEQRTCGTLLFNSAVRAYYVKRQLKDLCEA